MEEYVLEWFIGAQTSRCSCEQRRLLFIWRTGVSTSPLQLLAYRGLLPLKGFWVYVRAYGTTLSSVLTAKHDSTASFWPESTLLLKRQKTNKQSCEATTRLVRLQRLMKAAKWMKKKIHYMTMRNVCTPLFASFHFSKTFAAFIPFKGTQGYSKSGWQCVGMYTKCQLLSKPFFFQHKGKMLLIRGLSNLQSVGRGLLFAEDAIPCCSVRIWLKSSHPRDV